LLTLISAVGAVVTWRTVREVRRLRHYAQCVGDPACDASASLRPPALPGELGELARALERMRQRLAGRRQLERDVQGLKQQLQTPLKALGDAARGLPEHPTRQAIVTQVEQLRQLTERLLALARLESQAGLSQAAPIDLLALSEQVLAGYFARLQQRNVQVVWQAREAVQVSGDAAMLSMALSNLLLNAYQYAPAGSTLELSVSRQGREAAWCVRDHGPGVSADLLPQLGQRFFALPNPLDDRQGNGLGLALVAQVAALHGGRWQAERAAPGLRAGLILPLLNP
jgi:two-component system sensor histidine kinase CreC